MTLEGVDVSYANATTPIAGLSFVFCKAGQYTFQDSRWAQHSAAVRQAGLVLGAYWFWDDRGTAAAQAALFLDIAGTADLFILDFEGANTNTAGAKKFIALVKASGRKIGLYHSASGFPSWGQDYNWVAQWRDTPPMIPWTFWQYTGQGLDRDKFDGTLAELNALASLTTGGGNQGEVDVALTAIKGEDWKAKQGILREAPDTSSATLATLPVGAIVRSIAEATVVGSAYNWRVTEYQGQPAYFVARRLSDGAFPDWAPLVLGGDPAVDAELSAYIARTGTGTADFNAGVDAASKAALTAKK